MSLLDSSMMSSFIRYWCARSTTAAGCASARRRNKLTSSPPLRASAFLTCRSVTLGIETYNWRKLKVIADEDEGVRTAERSKTSWQGDLRSLINNAVIETSTSKQGAEVSDHLTTRRTDQLINTSLPPPAVPSVEPQAVKGMPIHPSPPE